MLKQGSHRLEKYLNIKGFLEKYLEIKSALKSIQYVHGNLCKHLGIDSSTDHPDRYSNLFLNAYINRHAHTEYSKMI